MALVVHQFPAACPSCNAITGIPYVATALPHGRTSVGVRCTQCGREWLLTMEGDPLAAAPKADLRQGAEPSK